MKNALFLSILSFQVKKKNHPFFQRMYILLFLSNQVYSLQTLSYDANFEEKCLSTFVNIHTKQTCGFSLEILSIQTVFGKKRVKEGK